jgi:integrase
MSVERRMTGGRIRWLARWRSEGQARSKTFDRKTDAQAFERERRRESALGAHGRLEPSPMQLEAWLEQWFDANAPTWKKKTRITYASVLDRWIVPYLGGVRLRDLGSRRVREWRDELREVGCPPTQTNKAQRILSSALGVAAREGLVPANPVTGLRSMPTQRRRPRVLSPVEIERVRLAMPTERDAVFWSLLALAGLRPQEARALRWCDVGEHLLTIDRAVSADEIGPTKTGNRRTVEIIPPLARDLSGHRRPHVGDNDLVIAGNAGAVLDMDNWRRRVWLPARDLAGLSAVFPYDARHGYASLLIHEGRSLPYVAAAMGHSSATTTLRHYAHLFDEASHATAEPMVAAIEAARAVFAA